MRTPGAWLVSLPVLGARAGDEELPDLRRRQRRRAQARGRDRRGVAKYLASSRDRRASATGGGNRRRFRHLIRPSSAACTWREAPAPAALQPLSRLTVRDPLTRSSGAAVRLAPARFLRPWHRRGLEEKRMPRTTHGRPRSRASRCVCRAAGALPVMHEIHQRFPATSTETHTRHGGLRSALWAGKATRRGHARWSPERPGAKAISVLSEVAQEQVGTRVEHFIYGAEAALDARSRRHSLVEGVAWRGHRRAPRASR